MALMHAAQRHFEHILNSDQAVGSAGTLAGAAAAR
jgi:hypothetical protein